MLRTLCPFVDAVPSGGGGGVVWSYQFILSPQHFLYPVGSILCPAFVSSCACVCSKGWLGFLALQNVACLPSWGVQGLMSQSPVVLSPFLSSSNLSLSLCIVVVIISCVRLLQVLIPLCGKLHFFFCPLVIVLSLVLLNVSCVFWICTRSEEYRLFSLHKVPGYVQLVTSEKKIKSWVPGPLYVPGNVQVVTVVLIKRVDFAEATCWEMVIAQGVF